MPSANRPPTSPIGGASASSIQAHDIGLTGNMSSSPVANASSPPIHASDKASSVWESPQPMRGLFRRIPIQKVNENLSDLRPDSSPMDHLLIDSLPRSDLDFIFSSPALSERRFSAESNLVNSDSSLHPPSDSEEPKESGLVDPFVEGPSALFDSDDEGQHKVERIEYTGDFHGEQDSAGTRSGIQLDTYDADRDDAEERARLRKRRAELEVKLEEEHIQHERKKFDINEQNDGANEISGLSLTGLENPYDENEELVSPIFGHTLSPFSEHDISTLLRGASSPSFNRMPTSIGNNGSKHVAFTSDLPMPDTPFNSTLKYFKQLKDKGNSTSKSRRNASLPEEIAELAKEARQVEVSEGIGGTNENDEDLEQYREMDLGPIDPAIEDATTGILAMLGSPTKPRVSAWMEGSKKGSSSSFVQEEEELSGSAEEWQKNSGVEEGEHVQYKLEIPGRDGDLFRTTFKTNAPVWDIALFIRECSKSVDASEDDIEAAVQKFLSNPSHFICHSEAALNSSDYEYVDVNQEQLIVHQEPPTFIKVIGMIPMAIVWIVAQLLAKYSGYDSLVGMLDRVNA